ncbi:MAG: DinB family protein, partial [Cyclobacteriaceae bacterium]
VLPIEEIVSKTWQSKEIAQEIARPKWGGALSFWIISLNNCQTLLEELEVVFDEIDPESIIHPHPISGPLDVLQRMEFLRFHLDRHHGQIENIKRHPNFPN